MPVLLKNIEVKIVEPITGEINVFSSVFAEAQFEDYIHIEGLIGYLQNFKRVGSVESLPKPITFGLKTPYNLPTTTLQISY